ncbi:MAG TPA: glycosyltransferase family 1 protein [Candidatus Saccharimonadales bacterium]|nr:glycosyltransferase family 1 protein [Candidatus Saccharimonadales bacterium]
MKVAIDVSPLSSGHKVRGVGFYLAHLKDALEKYVPQNDYIYFKNGKVPSSDVVHYPYFDPFFLTLPFFKKQKTVVTVHDLTPFVLPELFPVGIKGKIKWYFQKRALRKADAILTDSEASKNDIARIIGYPTDKIQVAYLAAGEEFIQITTNRQQITTVKKKYHLPDIFALYVGDVTANKNLPRLVKGALRANVTLVMVGKSLVDENVPNNPWTKDLMAVQELAKNNSQIVRLGFVPDEDLVAIYNGATVFVMPSLYEGFGLPILEAMACGCPVITSSKGSLREVAGDAAYTVNQDSIESIAEGLQKVIGDRQLQKKLSEKGLAQAKKFSWEKTAKETTSVYQKVVSGK